MADSANSWTAAYQDSFSFTIFQKSLKFMPTESLMPSNHLILHCPLLFLLSVFPSIRVFSNMLALHNRSLMQWNFIFSTSFSKEYLGLGSFRIDRFDVFAIQGTLKSLLQHHSLKGSVLQHSPFLWSNSHICTRPTGKTMALTMHTIVSRVMSCFYYTV